MTSSDTQMQGGVAVLVLPLWRVYSVLDIELAPVLHSLHEYLAHDDETELRRIVQWKSTERIFR